MKKSLLTIWMICAGLAASAQHELVAPFMNNVPQATYSNPTLIPEYKVIVGLSGLSSAYLSIRNTGFSAQDYFVRPGSSDSTMARLTRNMGQKNYVYVGGAIDLFYLKVKMRKGYYSLNITENLQTRLGYSKDFVRLLTEGNMPESDPFLNNTASMKGMSFDFVHYREYGLGFTLPIGEKWVLGGRGRLLFGRANVHTERFETTVTTDPDNAYAITTHTNYRVNTSTGPLVIENGQVGLKPEHNGFSAARHYLYNMRNLGLALDAGLTYKLNEKFSVTGVVKDFGFIRWKDNPKNYEGSGDVELSGLPFNAYTGGEGFNMGAYADSLKDKFTTTETSEKYTSFLTAQSYLLANYQLARNTRVGGGLYMEVYNGVHPALTANISQRLGRIMNLQLSYSMQNRTYDNLGAGVVLKLLPLQIYFLSDNLTAAMRPYGAKNVNFRFGINKVFGNPKK
jgi:hypothetical protein